MILDVLYVDLFDTSNAQWAEQIRNSLYIPPYPHHTLPLTTPLPALVIWNPLSLASNHAALCVHLN